MYYVQLTTYLTLVLQQNCLVGKYEEEVLYLEPFFALEQIKNTMISICSTAKNPNNKNTRKEMTKKGLLPHLHTNYRTTFCVKVTHQLQCGQNSSFRCICYYTSQRKHTITSPHYYWQLLLISTNLSSYLISVKVPNAFFVFFFLTHTNPSISHNDIGPFTGMVWISRIFN